MLWLTWKALELDRAEARAERRRNLEETVGSVLWQMDAELTRLLAAGDRPAGVLLPDRSTPSQRREGPSLLPSPLLMQPSPFVRLHFELQPDGTWSSPQCPGRWRAGVGGGHGVPREHRPQPATAGRAVAPGAVRPAAGRLPGLRARRRRCQSVAANARLRTCDQQAKYVSNLLDSPAVQQQLEEAQAGSGPPPGELPQPAAQRPNIRPGTQPAGQVRRDSELQSRDAVLQAAAQQARAGPAAEPQAAPHPGRARRGQPAAVDRSRLLLARRVESPGGTLIQGCWLDWPKIRQQLLGRVRVLLAGADLQPVTDVPACGPARVLASLPVQLVVPRRSWNSRPVPAPPLAAGRLAVPAGGHRWPWPPCCTASWRSASGGPPSSRPSPTNCERR